MRYLVGDLQGCAGALDALLAKIDYSASRDHLYVLGDLVNRGPDSLGTLRRLRDLGASATCLLGNHDWHLLAVAAGVRPLHASDTLASILDSKEREHWLEWIRARPMAVHAHGWLMVHAGVAPQWNLEETLALAKALEQALRETPPRELLTALFGNEPSRWSEVVSPEERLRFTLNTLTRIRYVTADGSLDFRAKGTPAKAAPGLVPWFDAPDRRTQDVAIAFGHWSTLGLFDRPGLLCLDSGCAWGGQLSAARLGTGELEIIQVDCAAQR